MSTTNNISEFASKTTATMKAIFQRQQNISSILSKVFIVLIVLISIFWFSNKLTLKNRNCANIESIYSDTINKISNKSRSDAEKNSLRDFTIKAAYNCCATGQFKNDYVGTCALKNVIAQGARFLDFEIYTLNDQPIVATSSSSDVTLKETYNYITFSNVIDVIDKYAFSGGTPDGSVGCPNPKDPLILHFRIKTDIASTFNKIADILKTKFESSKKLLGKEYSYEYGGNNLGALPLCTFLNKIIIIVNTDYTTVNIMDTDLYEFTNARSGSIYFRLLKEYDVKYCDDTSELIEYNKKYMSICVPDLGSSNNNINPGTAIILGCQIVALNYPNFDSYLEYYTQLFDDAGTAFILKNNNLLYNPETIDTNTIKKADPQHNYDKRSYSGKFGNFEH